DKEAREAADFYTSVFPNSAIKSSSRLHDTPSGSVALVSLELAGQPFTFISAGPLFRFTPAISFLVSCDTKEDVDALWRRLSKDGSVRTELGTYPWSERYGWLQDRYGVSWQLMHTGGRPIEQTIKPVLMFTQKVAGKAEEAMQFYTSVFPDSSYNVVMRYGRGEAPEREDTVRFGQFALAGRQFVAMDSVRAHDSTFNEAISFMVQCETQKEIDNYWSKLSADPKAEQCGWLKDKYGLSWQIVPTAMERML